MGSDMNFRIHIQCATNDRLSTTARGFARLPDADGEGRVALRPKAAHWRLTDKNGPTMVHTILKAGSGAATGHRKQLAWWPTDIIKYAKSVTRGGVTVFD